MNAMTVNGRACQVIRLLGKGKGGYSYLVEADGEVYVLKQIHHEPCTYYTFGDKLAAERCDYTRLIAADIRIPAMLDVDEGQERILKAYIDGPAAFDLVRDNAMPPAHLSDVQDMAARAKSAGLNID